MASPLHDIGKISTPDAILQKPGKLTDEEYSIMKEHSEKGAKIIKDTFGKHGNEDFIKTAYEVALYHHEKWNGKGYPKGLKGTEIPLAARIMSIADEEMTLEKFIQKDVQKTDNTSTSNNTKANYVQKFVPLAPPVMVMNKQI